MILRRCTGLIQAPDVSWKRSLKSKVQVRGEEWVGNGLHDLKSESNRRHVSSTYRSLGSRRLARSTETVDYRLDEALRMDQRTGGTRGAPHRMLQTGTSLHGALSQLLSTRHRKTTLTLFKMTDPRKTN